MFVQHDHSPPGLHIIAMQSDNDNDDDDDDDEDEDDVNVEPIITLAVQRERGLWALVRIPPAASLPTHIFSSSSSSSSSLASSSSS